MPQHEAQSLGEELWEKILPATQPAKKIWLLSRPAKIAAMVIVLAGAAGTFYWVRQSRQACCSPIAFTTVSTGIGEKKKLTLQDGSQLTLDAATTIRLREDFASNRTVQLDDGQVFFDVKKDDRHPFNIESQGLTTTVLGTSFTISAYKNLNNLSIGVVSGKISIDGPAVQKNILEKDQELVYNKSAKTYKTQPLDEALTAWQDGRILLNDLSFEEMSAITKKNFGIEIATDEPAIRNTRYTTELAVTMTPAAAAEVLAAIHNLKIRHKDNKIFFTR